MNKIIVLTGMMGCGKTTVGKMVAKNLNIPFYDLDIKIENEVQEEISNIFKKYGEDFFRKKESEVLEKIIQNNYGFVLSLGGGAFVSKHNRDLLNKPNIITIWLNTSINALIERLRTSKKRPLLQGGDLEKKLTDLLEQRNVFYSKANYKIDNSEISKKQVAEKIVEIYTKESLQSSSEQM